MRRWPARTNRLALTGLGVVLLLIGAFASAIGLGLMRPAGLSPNSDLGTLAVGAERPYSALIAVATALVLAVVCIAWLIRQIPRRDSARQLRTHTGTGVTAVSAEALTDAVAADVELSADVIDADAVLRGTTEAPELVVRVSVDESADIGAVVDDVTGRAARNCSTALGGPLTTVVIEIDTTARPRRQRSVVLAPGARE